MPTDNSKAVGCLKQVVVLVLINTLKRMIRGRKGKAVRNLWVGLAEPDKNDVGLDNVLAASDRVRGALDTQG